jgi:ABC-2 type transport system ATP-binding protein
MDEADRLCDRIAITDHGALLALGTPAELKTAYAGSAGDPHHRQPRPAAVRLARRPALPALRALRALRALLGRFITAIRPTSAWPARDRN